MKPDEKRQHDIGKCEMIDTQDPLKEPRSEAFLTGVRGRLLCTSVQRSPTKQTSHPSGLYECVLRCVWDAAMEL